MLASSFVRAVSVSVAIAVVLASSACSARVVSAAMAVEFSATPLAFVASAPRALVSSSLILFNTVVEKFSSWPSAAESSCNVLRASGLACVSVSIASVFVAISDVLPISSVLIVSSAV